MLELKSLVTLAIILLSSTANPAPNPEPTPEPIAEPIADPQWQWGQWGGQSSPPPRPGNDWDQPQQTRRTTSSVRPTTIRTTTVYGTRPTQTRDPDDDEPRWTPPPAWGPRTTPFGPKPTAAPKTTAAPNPKGSGLPSTTRPDYCSNTDLICTTTIDAPREPVPYAVTCAKARYNEYDVSNALTQGCYYWKKNQKVAGTEFPKPFANTQRFDFGDIKGPFFEFPLINDAAYVSGPTGPDRIIFSTPDCFLAGELTTTGAGRNGFTECTEEF